MPNGDFIKVTPGNYSSKEFYLPITHQSPNDYQELFNFAFKTYYYFGIQESIDIQEINELQAQPGKAEGNYLFVLKEEYQKYKQKNYRFGMYGTRDQIRDEYVNGKIFILKGGLRIGDLGYMIFFIAIGLFMFLMIILMSLELLLFGFFIFCFWCFWALILLLKLRIFLVISTIGVYYHRIISKGFFLWNKVVDLDAIRRTYRGITTTIVTLYFINKKKKKFASRPFLIKEFPKEMEMEMFVNLFKIAFNLRKNPGF
jgi:hypothetical protein